MIWQSQIYTVIKLYCVYPIHVLLQCYIAMAKGGLTPDHVLILPIAHHSSSLELPDDTRKEADKFKQALIDAFSSEGRPCVVFERNYRTDHMQIQVRNMHIVVVQDTVQGRIQEQVFGRKSFLKSRYSNVKEKSGQ